MIQLKLIVAKLIYADKIVQILAVFANGDTVIKLAMMKVNNLIAVLEE